MATKHRYDNHFEPHQAGEKDYLLHFTSAGCLARVTHVGGATRTPVTPARSWNCRASRTTPRRPSQVTYLFSLGDERFFLALDDRVSAPAGFAYESVNWLRHAEPQHLLFAAATASQLDRWYRDNRFCGRCGAPTELAPPQPRDRVPGVRQGDLPQDLPRRHLRRGARRR